MAWRAYQEKIANVFRDLGCNATVDAKVRGIRAMHKIDVWITFRRFGLNHKWVVECKHWKTPITKEKVLALRSVVEDVGADRGLLVAESGFQPGAQDAAKLTNIYLLTFAELERRAKQDILTSLCHELERRAAHVHARIMALSVSEQNGPKSWRFSPRPGVDAPRLIRMGGRVSILEWGFRQVRLGQFPALVEVDETGDKGILAYDLEEFLSKAAAILDEVEPWLDAQEAVIRAETQND
jgi:hypothetical protein